jgi:hypothetical protein
MVLRDRTNYFQTVPKDALKKNDLGRSRQIRIFHQYSDGTCFKEKQVVKKKKKTEL